MRLVRKALTASTVLNLLPSGLSMYVVLVMVVECAEIALQWGGRMSWKNEGLMRMTMREFEVQLEIQDII